MTPRDALQSDIFLTYVAIAIGMLTAAGVIIAILRWGFRRSVDHAWAAYKGWLVMLPLILGAVFLGCTVTIIALSLVSIIAFKEFARSTGLYRDWGMTGTVYVGIVAIAVLLLVQDPRLQVRGWYGMFMTLPVYLICAILLVPIVRNRAEGQLQTVALALVGFVYMGWMFGHLTYLANATCSYGYLLYLVAAVELNDVAAFTCGKLFGKHPMRSRISPNKTWEGAIGAIVVSMIFPWVCRFSFPHFTALDLVVTGLIVGIGGQLGDLSISVIKRDLGVKDMGALIHGHGGILDRIDSLIYVAPLFFHFVRWRFDIY